MESTEVICIRGGSNHFTSPPVVLNNRYTVTGQYTCPCGHLKGLTVGLRHIDGASWGYICPKCKAISPKMLECLYAIDRFANIDDLMLAEVNDEIMEILNPEILVPCR